MYNLFVNFNIFSFGNTTQNPNYIKNSYAEMGESGRGGV